MFKQARHGKNNIKNEAASLTLQSFKRSFTPHNMLRVLHMFGMTKHPNMIIIITVRFVQKTSKQSYAPPLIPLISYANDFERPQRKLNDKCKLWNGQMTYRPSKKEQTPNHPRILKPRKPYMLQRPRATTRMMLQVLQASCMYVIGYELRAHSNQPASKNHRMYFSKATPMRAKSVPKTQVQQSQHAEMSSKTYERCRKITQPVMRG